MFEYKEKNGVGYYTIKAFDETGLCVNCFTTRRGGVSEGCFASMNLRLSGGDSKENVLENYRIIARTLGVDEHSFVLSKQVHKTDVRIVGKEDCGNGLFRENRFDSADALITAEKGVALVTFYADCVPVYFLDKVRGVIALAHSGWRGTRAEIVAKTVRCMCENFGTEPENVLCAIGPSIGRCCFEVGDEVAAEFDEKYVDKKGSKPHIDLQGCIADSLCRAGVRRENITVSGICTRCGCDEFYSHRATGDARGTMAAVLMLK